jgi:glycosyltransferase XagB
MKKAIVVLPTYNERDNIVLMLQRIIQQQQKITSHVLEVLVVDDASPDGTGKIVRDLSNINPQIHLITGKKQGLGRAYIRGFQHALYELDADVVFEMDADFSHNPSDLPRLLAEINKGADFVIGSRYIPGGSIPSEWTTLRVVNSKVGNFVARTIAGLSQVNDCTGGFRAIRASLLKHIALDELSVKGFAFQMSLLHEAQNEGARITEVPIHFRDRVRGESKIRIKDITEFISSAFKIRFSFLQHVPLVFGSFLFGMIAGIIILAREQLHLTDPYMDLLLFIIGLSSFMIIQGIFTIWWMIYAWEDPKRIAKNKSPQTYLRPETSFTALIPAREEEHVIYDTIKAISRIDYPEKLKETLIICRSDDLRTIRTAQAAITHLGKSNIKLVIFNDSPINKPHSLNVGLQHASNDVVVVFDAEDEPHRNIYHIVNTIMLRESSDVVQSGVQLMNFRSTWFSTLNVLEYFFWFKSALHLFSKLGTVPLGGNTVFFKKKLLMSIGGWNEEFLTEDADIGIRLSKLGAKIDITYDERHATKEETPASLGEFIRQRTRWNQGFLQVFLEGEWTEFVSTKQKLLCLYILLWPFMQALLLLYLPISVITAVSFKLPMVVNLLAIVPVYLLILQMLIAIIGLYEFTRNYKIKFPLYMPLVIFLTFYPYQMLLGFSALRAIGRLITRNASWEKTLHLNAHREKGFVTT